MIKIKIKINVSQDGTVGANRNSLVRTEAHHSRHEWRPVTKHMTSKLLFMATSKRFPNVQKL